MHFYDSDWDKRDKWVTLPSQWPTNCASTVDSLCVCSRDAVIWWTCTHQRFNWQDKATCSPLLPSPHSLKGSLFHAFFLLLHGTCLIHLHCLTFPAEPPLSPPHHTHIHKASMPFQKQSQKTRAQGFWDSPNPSELSWSGIQLIHCLLGVCSVSSKWGSITLGNNPKYSSCNGAVPD